MFNLYVFIDKVRLELCKVYMNDVPEMTLIYILEKSNLVICV